MAKIYNHFSNISQLNKKIAVDVMAKVETLSKKSPTLLLLSGGSAMSIYEYWSFKDVNVENLTIAFLDERFDKKNSNFEAFKASRAYSKIQELGIETFSIDQSAKTGLNEADKFNKFLKDCIKKGTKIVAIIGMGPDGHTSGMMPFPENRYLFNSLFTKDKYAVFYDASGKNEFPLRITTTMTFLKEINYTYAYITGINKAQKLKESISKKKPLYELPFAIITEMKNVSIYTDIKSL